MRLLRMYVGPLVIVFALVSASHEQAPSNSSAKPSVYEVVSIKPSKPGMPVVTETLPNGFRETNTTLDTLVHDAFQVFYENQVQGMPSWAESELYDIEAKVDADTADSWRKLTNKERRKEEQPMLQALLADRCQLKVHFETKELPVYDLVIAKVGLKIKEAPQDEAENEVLAPGIMLTAHAISMQNLTYTLSGTDGRLVVDKTGLGDKRFDFKLHWTPNNRSGTGDSAPSLFTALEEQLGLKLIASKEAVNVLVIDQMQRPSPN